jgi:hypothetical protein
LCRKGFGAARISHLHAARAIGQLLSMVVSSVLTGGAERCEPRGMGESPAPLLALVAAVMRARRVNYWTALALVGAGVTQ